MTARPLSMIAAALHGATWAIRPETLQEFRAIVRREQQGESRAAELGEPSPVTDRVTVRDGVATVAITGPLFRYANLMTAYCGATSYADVQHALQVAAATPGLKAIVLAIDSPGGECRGMLDTAEMIYAMRGTVPIVAHVDGQCCSAALALARAADRVYADPAAAVGCAGAIFGFDKVDEAEHDARMVYFIADKSPRKNASVLGEDGQSQMQALINGTGDAYFAALARYAGADPDTVHEAFGLGAVFSAQEALARGMIDGLMLAEQVGTQCAHGLALPTTQSPSARSDRPLASTRAATSPGARSMADTPQDDPEVTPTTTAVFAAGAAVRSTVARDVAVAENDEGTVVEVMEGQTVYAVEFPNGTYNYLREDELAEAAGGDTAPVQARIRAGIAAHRVAKERERIAGLTALTGKVPAATLNAALVDPTQTAGSVALAQLLASKGGPSALAALQADAQGTPATPSAITDATPSPRAAASARAARINQRYAGTASRDITRSAR
jgi:capsid assembly protease